MTMTTELQSPVAFHLTGRRAGADLTPVTERGLHPAMFARYRDLTALRYDFPLVLLDKPLDGQSIAALTRLVDRALAADRGGDAGRLRAHALRIEREMRAMVAVGARETLQDLLEQAAQRVASACGKAFPDSLARLRRQLRADGAVLDCDGPMTRRLVEHAWQAAQADRVEGVRRNIEHLILGLTDILRADEARSEAARAPNRLQAAVGSIHADAFDFDALSQLLSKTARGSSLTAPRRQRIERTLKALQSQRFYRVVGGTQEIYAFHFEDCASALRAFRERVAEMARLVRATAVARLEIEGTYSEPRHDPLFEHLGSDGLDLRDLAMFPDTLVYLNTRTLTAADQGELMEILVSGLPMKILVQSDDLLEAPLVDTGHLAFGARSRQLAHMAIGLNDVFVLQSSASHLPRAAEAIGRAMQYRGPALFSVFSGANAHTPDLPPYLNAAAAMESRAFPAFAYDPSAGSDWASRFTLEPNPQPDRDWPVHGLAYEGADHQRVIEDLGFTLLDYVACDDRFAEHFAKVPRASWSSTLVPVSECLDAETRGVPDKLPSLPMIDAESRLQKVIVDERLLREARRVRDLWRSLQELGGIRNSHVAKALERAAAEAQAAAAKAKAEPAAAAPVAATSAAPAAAAEPEKAPSPDEPYIETARCSSCNECIQLNGKMFAYDGNQQARIVDPMAGTYRQLVEAAERCQVAVIHPGKPKNPSEPGLEELLQRAEAFQ